MDYNLDNLLENLYDGVYFVDRERRITFWNRAAETITGFAAAAVLGRRCSDNILMHVDQDGNSLCLGRCPLAASMEDRRNREAEVFLRHRYGHRVPVQVRTAPLRDRSGDVIGGAELFSDVSEKYSLMHRMKELEELALIDPLTRLANRLHGEDELQARLQEARRYGVVSGVLFLDIDHFKRINDTWGHDAGDQVLRTVAQTLRLNARPFDLYCRWGGEEFVGLIRNVHAAELLRIASRCRALVEHTSIAVPGGREQVTISIGATLIRPEESAEAVLHRADALMYRSKAEGRNRVTADCGE